MPPPRSVPVSVMIPAKNELANMRECLESVAWADEVVVVDSSSTDGTVELSREMGATVIDFKWNGRFPKKKNWAIENVPWKNDWLLILDADERITPALAREIAARVAAPGKTVGYYINRRFMFLGGWLRHCGYYPSYNLRLFLHKVGRYEKLEVSGDTRSGDNEVHEHVLVDGGEADGRVRFLKNDMLHFAYPSIDVWVEKHNRYSNWEARVIDDLHRQQSGQTLAASPFGNPVERKRWIKRFANRLPMRPTLRFFYHYVWKRGFLDGYRGFVFCRLLGIYEFLSIAKAAEWRVQRTLRENASRRDANRP